MSPNDSVFYQQLGKRMATLRKARGLTQTALAEQLGISQQTMAHYENGRLRIALSMLPHLGHALDCTVHDLLDDTQAHDAPRKRGPTSKLHQQIEQVHTLPRAKQKFVSDMLDTVIQGNV